MRFNRLFFKYVLGLSVMTGSTATHAQTLPKKSFQIDVTVKNLKVPAKLILTVRDINQWSEYIAESANGKFTLSGLLKEPSFAYLVMKYGDEVGKFPRPGNVSQLYLSYVPIHVTTQDSLKVAIIEGGHLQKELEELTSAMGDSLTAKRTDAVKTEIISGFIRQHPTSFASLYAVQNFSQDGTFSIDPDKVEPLFKLLSPMVKNTLSGRELSKEITIARQTAIGSIAPDFVQKDTLDRNVMLSSFRGKYVLIDFWASWCKPCRIENPALVKTYHEYKDRNFTIVSVSLDNSKASWLKAISKDKLTWTHTSDLKFWKNEVALLYGVKTVPQNFLLDPSGKIIGRNIPSAELGAFLKKEAIH